MVDWILGASLDEFDEATLDYTKRLLLKTIAGMAAGSREPVGLNVINYLKAAGGSPQAGVIGGGFKSSVENSALAVGTFAHASELEDDRFPGPIGTYWIFPAFYSLGEWLGSSGREIMEAAIISWEADWRMAKAGPAWHMAERGLVTNAWFGAVAVAAGAARLMKLDSEQTLNAMSIAASQAAGLVCQLGWDAHFVESGHSCRAGLLSAFLAQGGATGRGDFLERPDGIYGPIWELGTVNVEALSEGLGQPPYDINNVWIKKYPSCYGTHMPLDALMLLIKEHGFTHQEVDKIEVEADQWCAVGLNRPHPQDLGQARFSLQYTLAEYLLNGGVSLESFNNPEKLDDPLLKELQSKISPYTPDDWKKRDDNTATIAGDLFAYGAGVIVTLKDGRVLKKHLDRPIGHPQDPLSYDQVRDLCRPFIDEFVGDENGDKIAAMTAEMENLPDIKEMMNILTNF
jgi:2-methylcitrate dehydratase PrpD